jgi:hypothetical protein
MNKTVSFAEGAKKELISGDGAGADGPPLQAATVVAKTIIRAVVSTVPDRDRSLSIGKKNLTPPM